MSETRVHTGPDNRIHVAEIAPRRRGPHRRSAWLYAAIVILAIPVLVGLIDILSRVAMLVASARAQELPAALSSEGAAGAADPAPIVPARLSIPAIGVNAAVQKVGLNSAGALQAPGNFTDVGWYQDGATPGDAGSAVFDGHVNNALTRAGVFEHLAQLKEGDTILVSDALGQSLAYSVTGVRAYDVGQAPAEEIFSRAGPSQLVLITCDGSWDAAKKEFDQRLVVYAKLQTQS